MTITEIASVATKDGAQLIRYRKDSVFSGTAQYDCKPMFTGSKRGWTMVDSFTASAILAVSNALNEANRAKFNNLPIDRLVSFCWKHVGGAR